MVDFNSAHTGSEVDAEIFFSQKRSGGDLIPVLTEADLPSPIANVIKLVEGKLYECQQKVTISAGVQIDCKDSGFIGAGVRFPEFGIEGDVADPLLIITSGDMHIDGLLISNINASGSALNLVTTGTVVIRASRIIAVSSLGLISANFLVLGGPSFIGATSGLTITGNAIAQLISGTLFNGIGGSALVYDENFNLLGNISITNSTFNMSAAISGIEDQRPSKQNRMLISGCQFNSTTTPLTGLSKDDPEITLTGNIGSGIENSSAGFDAVQDSLDTLALTDTVEADVVIDDWTIVESLWTVSPTTGKATNNNKDSSFRRFNIDSNIAKLLGGSQLVTFRMKLNANIISERTLDLTSSPQLLIMHAKAIVVEGDVISLTAITTAGDVDITFEDTHQIG